ncbi:transmembrane amino acid transporter protein-domain-containing protein [Dissophora ornata]|nr:transmembrane amino acid transporter protein-domain-containing protein [Dissophora ornata]
MLLIAILCLHPFLLLVKCRVLHPGSYGNIGQHFYGRWMCYIVLFAIAISQFGFYCGYCIFFAQQFAIVVDSLGGASLDKVVWIAIFFVIPVPFTLVRNVSKLGFSTLVADLCIIVGLVYLYVYDIKELVINNGSPTPLQPFNSKDFGLFIGTAYLFELPFSDTDFFFVFLKTFWHGHPYLQQYGRSKAVPTCINHRPFGCVHALGLGPPSKTRLLKENIVRVIVDFAVVVVAYAGYTKLDIFISFVDSFACAPLLFIFPHLYRIKAFPGQPTRRKMGDIVLILFGFLVFFYTLIITIQSFSRAGG